MCLIQECIKFVVFAFNLIFVLVGAALITLGVIFHLHFTNVTDAIPDSYNLGLVPILTIVVGSIIFLIAFFGCCGAVRESPCLLSTYAIILLIIFVGQIALGVFAFLEIKNEDELKNEVKKGIDTLFQKSDNTSKEAIDYIQSSLKCCGTNGPSFWDTKPKSCYPDKDTTKKNYTDGCENEFFEFLKSASRIIGIVVLALAATEVIGATLSLCLANSARNKTRRQYY